MRLLILRHAPAGDRALWARAGRRDGVRPLTPKGRRRMRSATKGLRRILPGIDLVASSALARAVQTADIVREAFPKARAIRLPELAPQSPREALLRWLRGRREKTIALVGHEPALGRLISWFSTGRTEAFVRLKKGQACLLEFSGRPRPSAAKLLWSLQPAHLRKLDWD